MRTLIALVAALAAPAEAGAWRELFDGKTLQGWSAPDMAYWTVEDGAITGTVTAAHLPPRNQFIVWRGGEVADFELTFQFRVFGDKANSGMQLRSEVREHGLVWGYQADIARPGAFLGGVFDEYGPRGSLAARGQSVFIDGAGHRTVTPFADPAKLLAGIDLAQWHTYQVVARGPKITLAIDGQRTAELDDHERGRARARGVLAMPVIPQPMKVQFRAIRLRAL
jgi:hypothetical protein